jgi:hypothetical protein
MSDQTHDQDQDGEGATPLDERADLLGQIASLREEAKQEHHLDVEVPGYKGLLWMRFRPFPVAQTEARIPQMRKQKGPVLLDSSIDTLIDSLEQLMLLPARFNGNIGDEGKNLIPVDDVSPVGFDQRAAELFRVPNPGGTARGVVLGLFPTEQSIIAIQLRVSNWMVDVTRESDSGLLSD